MTVKPIFISHASDDEALAYEFVEQLLRLGAGVGGDQILFSSGHAEYSVPSGTDLMANVRAQVSASTLVIALITPTYQTRPVCVAELGAAWGKADSSNFLPVLYPDLPRSELQGVLAPLTIRKMNDPVFLEELHKRACAAARTSSNVSDFTRSSGKWLSALDSLKDSIAYPNEVSLEEYNELKMKYDGAQAMLIDKRDKIVELSAQIAEYRAAHTDSDRSRALAPKNKVAEFDALRSKATEALDRLRSPFTRDVIRETLDGGEVAYPDLYASDSDDAAEAKKKGWLKIIDGVAVLDYEFPEVSAAADAVSDLDDFLKKEHDEAFDDWWSENFNGQPRRRLPAGQVWDRVFPSATFGRF